MSSVTMKQLLEAGVHFGHQSRRWNPKMKPYIYTERAKIYIVDLKKTLRLLREACRYVRDTVADGGKVLFVGTKKQAKDIIREGAASSGMYFVNNRWLGGTLTNFQTVRKSTLRMIELERMFQDGTINQYSKKEQSMLGRELESLKKNLDGLRHMDRLPDVMFVVDPSKETIAVLEAKKLRIPIVAVVDTNCDPDPISYVIPGNDDAIRSIKLMVGQIAEACQEGLAQRGAAVGGGAGVEFSEFGDGEYAENEFTDEPPVDAPPEITLPEA
ncbi:MAG: 30S ribosomal protein S2 [Candidatus Sumerlaeia bacterium]|nr:30S ribosomal protein S2 [Candidatus Sumerlaeia bacterium]